MLIELRTILSRERKLRLFRKKWRKLNIYNETFIDNGTLLENIFPIDRVKVGRHTYGPLNILTYGNPEEHLEIGSFCSIGPDVKFLLGGEHPYKGVSTFPFKVKLCGFEYEAKTKGPIIIGDDVWIGARCTILSGVNIGTGAIISAGSTVYRDIPPYAIWGNGKIIGYRFDEKFIEKLLKIDYSRLTDDIIKKNVDLLYKEVDDRLFESDLYNLISLNEKEVSRDK